MLPRIGRADPPLVASRKGRVARSDGQSIRTVEVDVGRSPCRAMLCRRGRRKDALVLGSHFGAGFGQSRF